MTSFHTYLKEQDKIDTELETTHKREIRSALRSALHMSSRNGITSRGTLRHWFIKKLDALLACGLANTSSVTDRACHISSLHFDKGMSVVRLAAVYGLKKRTIYNDINSLLDCVIRTAPQYILRSLIKPDTDWILKGCKRCEGDLCWDAEGAHEDKEGEYCCFQCGQRYRFDETGQLVSVYEINIGG